MDFAIAKAEAKAEEKGINIGIEKGIIGLIKQNMLSDAQIAEAMGVSIEIVQKLRKNNL